MTKQSFLLTTIICICIQALAQKNFEGKIIYQSSDVGIGKLNTEIYFGTQKIKIKETSFNGYSNLLSRITDFEKAVTYYLNENNKVYYERKLAVGKDTLEFLKAFPVKNKKILGYTCSAYQSADELSRKKENDLIPSIQICVWYADSLYYIIDSKYNQLNELEKATNGTHVGMGLEINSGDSNELFKVLIEPVSISSGQIPDSVFSVPKDYKKVTEKEFFETMRFQMETMQAPSSPVIVTAPTSVSSKADPDKSIIISLEKEGKVFLTMGKNIRKIEILNDINKTKGLNLSAAELIKLDSITTIGMPMAKLKTMLNSTSDMLPEQMEGIPVKDSVTNELTDWIRSVVNVYQADDTIKLENIILIKGDANIRYPDFRNIKYALKNNGIFKFRIVTNND